MSRIRVAAAVVAVVSTACTWGMIGHDGGRSAWSPAENGITTVNVASLHEVWNAIPGPLRPSAPVAADGHVFVTTQPSSTSGGTPGALIAYDAAGTTCATGTPLRCSPQWSTPFEDPQTGTRPSPGSPIVAAGKVWAAASGFDLGLLAQLRVPNYTVGGGFDLATGAQVSPYRFMGYPAESDGTIFGVAIDSYTSQANPRFASYPSLDAMKEDGSPGTTVVINTGGTMAVGGGRVYLAQAQKVEVYDAAPATSPCHPSSYGVPQGEYAYYSCTPLWTATMTHPGAWDGLPVVANGLLYVPEVDGGVEVFDAAGCGAATCTPVWTARAGTVHVGELAVTDTTLYAPSDDGHLYAFPSTGCGASTCTPAWSVNAGSGTHAPTVAGSVVLAGTQDGRLVAVDARGCGTSTCPVLRSVAVGSPLRQPIAVSAGRVFALTDDGVLHGFAV
jgi:hypothetical protein